MTPRRMDFSRKPGLPWPGWLLLFLGLALLGGSWALKRHWQQESAALRQRLDQAAREVADRQAADRARHAMTPADARRWAQLRQQQAWPWPVALQSVDDAVAEPVYLLAMSLQSANDSGGGQLKLEAQAPTWSDALSFVEKLREAQAATSPSLGPPQLSSQQQALDAGTNAPVVRFVVTMPVRSTLAPTRSQP